MFIRDFIASVWQDYHNLSPLVVLPFQVTEVCGAKHLGYFGPSQFYVALKLLAAAQSGLPVHPDSVTASKWTGSERRRCLM